MIKLLIFASGIVFGFFLPGFAVSMFLKSPVKLLSSFIISSLILFYCIFLLGLFHIPIRFAAVMSLLVTISIILFLLIRRQIVTESKTTDFSLKQMRPLKWMQWSPVLLTGIIMLFRSVMQPLSAWDTTFRWNFLALKLFELGKFDFYPPFSPKDFGIYFYPDGIPPMISFSYYWLYEAFGGANPMITGFYVTLQFCLIYVLCYKTASHLFSRLAGFFSVAILVSSTLFFWSVLMGQETGMTALSLAATVYFLSTAVTGESNLRIMILGGCAAALGALSREYGCVFIFCGILVCFWKRQSLKSIMVFIGVALILSMPWYIRNWIVCGNPFYNNPIGQLFAVNPVHAAIMKSYAPSMGFFSDSFTKVHYAAMELLMTAPLQTVLGIVAAFIFFRRYGYLAISAIIVAFLWIYSVGQTSGGLFFSMRVLSPALVMLSVLGGGLLAGIAAKKWMHDVIAIFLFCACLLAGIQNLVIPFSAWRLPMRYWLSAGFLPLHDPGIHILDCIDKVPPNARILSDNAFVHAVLSSHPSRTVSIVPVWSPEMEFLFYKGKIAKAACRELRQYGINYVLYSPGSLNNIYLEKFPFFAGYRKFSIPLYEGKHGILYELADDIHANISRQ